MIAVVDGRETLVAGIRQEPPELHRYLRREIRRLLSNRAFQDALPGYLLPDAVSQARAGIILKRLEDLTSVIGQSRERRFPK